MLLLKAIWQLMAKKRLPIDMIGFQSNSYIFSWLSKSPLSAGDWKIQ
jgi:hypothetical protein